MKELRLLEDSTSVGTAPATINCNMHIRVPFMV